MLQGSWSKSLRWFEEEVRLRDRTMSSCLDKNPREGLLCSLQRSQMWNLQPRPGFWLGVFLLYCFLIKTPLNPGSHSFSEWQTPLSEGQSQRLNQRSLAASGTTTPTSTMRSQPTLSRTMRRLQWWRKERRRSVLQHQHRPPRIFMKRWNSCSPTLLYLLFLSVHKLSDPPRRPLWRSPLCTGHQMSRWSALQRRTSKAFWEVPGVPLQDLHYHCPVVSYEEGLLEEVRSKPTMK